ncbi:ABC transporter substrate-binding protein [Halorubrum trueperi]|uniref:ABC transporter substrate-binding protein n=1 Tax=Halorubrum trueperi TaxID=2004704 RepID=A0ABD5UNG3_9EURY
MAAHSRQTGGSEETFDRRTLLQALSGAAAVGLAGCSGGSGEGSSGSDENLGERVSTIQMEYWSDYGGFTTTQEQMAPTIRQGIEGLGTEVDIVPKDLGTNTGQQANDENRDNNISFTWWVPASDRLDPQELLNNMRLDWAGANGQSNTSNYADCEYTRLLIEQTGAETPEEREEGLHETIAYMSEDCAIDNLCPVANIGAWRTDMVDIDGVGTGGLARSNAEWIFKSELTDGDELVVGIDPIATETTNWMTHTASMPESMWQHMIHSPIHKYDENYEIVELLGSVDVVDSQEVVVELFDDATFTNGDQVTAQDVKFTFEQILRGGDAGAYPGAAPVPYDAIEAVDEQTVRFTFTESYIPFAETTLMRWGILHQESFEEAGAVEDPGGASFETPIVSSGPLEVVSIEQGQRIVTEPHDGHPQYEAAQPVTFEAYRNEESMINALGAGEAHVAVEISPPNATRVNEEIDDAEARFEGTHTSYNLQYICHTAPCKFTEFRKAIGASVNRDQLVNTAFDGRVEPDMFPTYISENHPMFPPEDMLYEHPDTSGDVEAARTMLEDEGWGWDGDGNLHYPPDADLEPLWPEGEVPSAEDFPCIDELGLDP